ncbi:MAG: hypothetical protein VKS61_11185 [Candidatus Sericytochromatia bacterium]|nr:hypothetical protein [Candidatus Sericytochromatia bacterium]
MVAEDAVDAVRHVPDLPVALAQGHDPLLEQVEAVVAHHFHGRAADAQVVGGVLDAAVGLLVEDHRRIVGDEHRKGRHVGQRRARGHEHGGLEDLPEQVLELSIEGARQEHPRGGKLAAVASHRVHRARDEPLVELQPHVAARAHVHERPTGNGDVAPIEGRVFGGLVHQPQAPGLSEALLHGRQRVGVASQGVELLTGLAGQWPKAMC